MYQCNRQSRCCARQQLCCPGWGICPPVPPIPPPPYGAPAENIPYPSSFTFKAWNFPPEGAVSDFFVQNDMTIYTTLVINTQATVRQVAVLSGAFAGVIGPVYVGIYDYNRNLVARSNDVASNIVTSSEPIMSKLPLQGPVVLDPGKYYVALTINLGGGQGFNLLSTISFMYLLQEQPYSNYFFTGGDLPNPLPYVENGFYGVAPFFALL